MLLKFNLEYHWIYPIVSITLISFFLHHINQLKDHFFFMIVEKHFECEHANTQHYSLSLTNYRERSPDGCPGSPLG